jgi:deoxycytidylate deaminase
MRPTRATSRFLMKHANLIDTLKRLSLQSDIACRHGAALFKGKKVFAVGYNKSIKQIAMTNNKIYKITLHAEESALLKARQQYDMRGEANIIIIRSKVRTNGQVDLLNSRPCDNCINKMMKSGIRKVYYSDKDGNIVFEYLDEMECNHISAGNRVRIR